MRTSLHLRFPDGDVEAAIIPYYMVLYRHQYSDIHGISYAEFRDGGWCNCAEPGQPEILQWFDPQEGRFKDGKPLACKDRILLLNLYNRRVEAFRKGRINLLYTQDTLFDISDIFNNLDKDKSIAMQLAEGR